MHSKTIGETAGLVWKALGSKGKTAGRGTKGTGARKNVPARFEGGQMPLHMRVPKLKGFRNPARVEYQVINLTRFPLFLRISTQPDLSPVTAGSHCLLIRISKSMKTSYDNPSYLSSIFLSRYKRKTRLCGFNGLLP